ncbi:MAG: hypothetical protein WBX22_25845 [Silvibacterium sp.]
MGGINSTAVVLHPTPYDVPIEDPDKVPIHTDQFASNWELSRARATRMARLFIERFAFQPGRLAAAGFAEYHPVTGNDNS